MRKKERKPGSQLSDIRHQLYRENDGLLGWDNNGVIIDFRMKLLFHNSNSLSVVLMDID